MSKKEFHTAVERKDGYEIRYIAGEDFVECGSVAGEQYLAALYFCKLYEKSFTPELFPVHIKFIEKSLLDFLSKHRLNISQEYPSYHNSFAGFYQKRGEYHSLLVTIFSDYRTVWVRLEEVSRQTFYPEFRRDFVIDAKTLMYGIEKFKELCKKYRTKSFYRELIEGDIRD